MNFNAFFLRSFRVLLLPFALVYGLIIAIRNWLYNENHLRSAEFALPIICVGNLVAGGTGKSPMVEYLVEMLQPTGVRVAVLSRGYKRKTKGYALAGPHSTALDIGDEPMEFYRKFAHYDVPVGVGEERIVAIPQLLHDRPDIRAIILDDAFQHRAIHAGFNIVLTEYHNLYTRDFFLPTGDLRDEKASAHRADLIIVTKCPGNLTGFQRGEIIRELKPLSRQQVFFTTIEYGLPYHIIDHSVHPVGEHDEVLLVSGIANPRPLKDFLHEHAGVYYQMDFSDHHIFRIEDLREISKRFDRIQSDNKIILTTEKDAIRLLKFSQELEKMPFYVIPVRHRFLFDEARVFNDQVTGFIRNFVFRPRQGRTQAERKSAKDHGTKE